MKCHVVIFHLCFGNCFKPKFKTCGNNSHEVKAAFKKIANTTTNMHCDNQYMLVVSELIEICCLTPFFSKTV